MTAPIDKFQTLLRELFQFDCTDLDFGIYRIMNYKRSVIEKFITQELPEAVADELDRGALADQSHVANELKEVAQQIRTTLGRDALDADGNLAETYHGTPLGKKYQILKGKATGGRGHEALEAGIFNHLYAFFTRYYQDGDFISKRRYSRRQRYAIPYNGEEVYLYWANNDQYYVKTGEHFRDYTFTSRGVTVHFKLLAADVEQNNVKGDKRFFLPSTKETEWDEGTGQLVIPFEFRPLTEQEEITYGKRNQQDTIIDESFFPTIAACEPQWAEWKELFHIDEKEINLFNSGKDKKGKRIAFLKDHPTLVLDTRHFDADFVDTLLASMDDLDGMTDGLLIHSENFQALGFLLGTYGKRIKCIYIDPPFNTDASPILYKNGYKSSTWVSLLENRLRVSRSLLSESGVLVAAIDDEQQRELSFLLSHIFDGRLLGTFSVRTNPSGRPTKSGYSVAHEYLLYAGQGEGSAIGRMPPTKKQIARFSQCDTGGAFEWRNLRREGSNSDRAARRHLYYPIYIKGASMRVPKMTWNEADEQWVVEEKPRTGELVVFPDNDKGVQKTWRWEGKTVMGSMADLAVRKDRSGRDYVYYKRRLNEEGVVSVSCWFDAKYSATEHGTALLKAMFGKSVFSYPKSIHAVTDSLYIAGASKRNACVLDYFAGSGTTGHSVINLNRKDGGSRKFILVEMGQYFDTVLLPRIKKITFSPEWKDGKPKRMATQEEAERSPRIVKYIRLESYEDTLNNIEFDDASGQQAMEFEDYLLGLHVQTRQVYHDDGRRYLIYRGRIDHRKIAVIWRETEGWQKADLERDKKFVAAQKLTEGADEVFINGDSFIQNARTLESVFKTRMFAGVDV